MRTWVSPTIICLWYCWPLQLTADEDEVEDVQHFEEVHAQIEKVLPKGWAIRIELSNKNAPWRLRRSPRLVISSNTPLQTSSTAANPPFVADENDRYKPNVVNVRLFVVPQITQQEFDHLVRRNMESEVRRNRFEKERAKQGLQTLGGYIYPDDLPASTPEQCQIQREYSLLMMHTEPIDLPTYRYRSLSFEAWRDAVEFKDQTKSAEYSKIYDELDRILTPYQKRPERE